MCGRSCRGDWAVNQLHTGVGEACAKVCVVAGLRLPRALQVTGLVLPEVSFAPTHPRMGSPAVVASASMEPSESPPATMMEPPPLRHAVFVVGQLVGDELSATRIAHGPHLGSVQVVLADEGLREGSEELTVGVHVFPPGDAVAGCIGVRGDDRHEDHVAGC